MLINNTHDNINKNFKILKKGRVNKKRTGYFGQVS